MIEIRLLSSALAVMAPSVAATVAAARQSRRKNRCVMEYPVCP
jgi:hypothetical protein